MALPTGLLPVLAFALTVGVAIPVTAAAHLLARRGRPFSTTVRASLLGAGLAYLAGVAVVWTVAGTSAGPDLALWEVPATLVLAGLAAGLGGGVLPLAVGRRLVSTLAGVDSETALRSVTDGWPVAALAVFGILVAPGGPSGTLLAVDGPGVCLAGFCGVPLPLLAGTLVAAVVAVLGPGLVGVLVTVAVERLRQRRVTDTVE